MESINTPIGCRYEYQTANVPCQYPNIQLAPRAGEAARKTGFSASSAERTSLNISDKCLNGRGAPHNQNKAKPVFGETIAAEKSIRQVALKVRQIPRLSVSLRGVR